MLDRSGTDVPQITDGFKQCSIQLELLKTFFFLSKLRSQDIIILLFLLDLVVLFDYDLFPEDLIVSDGLDAVLFVPVAIFPFEGVDFVLKRGGFGGEVGVLLDAAAEVGLFLGQLGCFGES